MMIPRLFIIITLPLSIRSSENKDDNHCFFENRTYRVSDTWHSKDHCLLFVCEKDDHNGVVSIYSKICPKQADCIPSDVYVKDCCRYCKKKDAIVINKDETMPNYSKFENCKRTCDTAKPPMDCFYNFKLETFEAFGNPCYDCPFNRTDCTLPQCIQVDGIRRTVSVANRMMPGPAIEVCQYDRIIVDVQNELISETTTIHWHGIRQIKTQYMDGVQFLTQCPILPSTSFQYTFEAEEAGTYFWHSHAGFQRSDGLTGALIVRKPKKEDLLGNLYDIDSSEYIVFIQDWIHTTTETLFTSFYYSTSEALPTTFLVNGKGRYFESLGNKSEELLSKTLSLMPFEEFNVKKGFRYRFRVINGGFLVCPVVISVDNHNLLIISTDGLDIEPVVVESLVIYAGERFDFVIDANQSIDNYWIRFKGLLLCEELKSQQLAILRYEGAGSSDPTAPLDYTYPIRTGIQLSTPIVGPPKNNTMKISQLQSLEPSDQDDLSARDPDYRFIIGIGMNVFNNMDTFFPPGFSINSNNYAKNVKMAQLNHISFEFPSSPLLSQLPENMSKLCNETSLREQGADCENEYCHCVHVQHVKLNSIVEIVLFDYGNVYISHPFHMHGYSFQILGMDYVMNVTRDKIIKMAENNQLRQNYNDRPPIKDTVAVPSPGYTLIRFRADNPGFWLLHCHFEFHLMIGMGTVFKIGEYKNWFPPQKDFPKC